MGRGTLGKCAATAFAVSSLSHCVGATEIMVDLHTDVSCDVVAANGVTIAVGAPNDDTTGIVTTTSACDAGALGTIALLPHGDIGGAVAFRAVLGVNAKAEDCKSPDFSGCIVARRSLRYSPHTMLSLPVELDQDCLNDPCGPDSTCVHGSCTDAGTTCEDNVCAIDAGPPVDASPPLDAGACTDTPSTLVGSTSIIATPHIARTAHGYAVAWLTAPGSIYAEIVDVNGNIIAGARPIAQSSGTAKLDAIATDANDQNYLVVYEDSGLLSAAVAPTTTGSAIPYNVPTSTGPVGGAFWETTQSSWITGGVTNGSASLYALAAGQITQTPFAVGSPTHVAVARFGSTYYATDVEGSVCGLYTCDLKSGGTFACQENAFPTCSSMRAAADASNVIVSYVSNGTMFFFRVGTTGPMVSSGPVDDLDAMVPLVVGATPYRIVWRSTGAILTDTFPVRGNAADTLDTSAFGSQTGGAGFDAVADDPSETGYAVVYAHGNGKTQSIQFLHRCK